MKAKVTERMRCLLTLNSSLDVESAEAFWREATGFTSKQFHKTQRRLGFSSKGKRGQRWPNGVCLLRAGDIRIRQKLNRWMELALTE